VNDQTPDLATLWHLVREHQDRIEIAELCAHYGYAIDDRDLDKLCRLLRRTAPTPAGRAGRRSAPSSRSVSTSGA
jgi:hypothetical protein